MSALRSSEGRRLESLVACLRPRRDLASNADDSRLEALVAWSRCTRALWLRPDRRLCSSGSGSVRMVGAQVEREASFWRRAAPACGTGRFLRSALARLPESASGDWSEAVTHRSDSVLFVLQFDRETSSDDRFALGLLLRTLSTSSDEVRTDGVRALGPECERLMRIGRATGTLVHDLRHLLTLAGLQLQRARSEADPALVRQQFESLSATLGEARASCASGLEGAMELASTGCGLSSILESSAWAATECARRRGSVRVKVECPSEMRAGGDPIVLGRLVRNLVLNAIEASADGSEVCVQASEGEESVVSIRVSDRGHGIAQGEIEHLYAGARSGGRGSGLGSLSVLDAIARLHGTIEVGSRLGEGTSVVVRFPVLARRIELLLLDPWPLRREARAAELARQGALVHQAADPAEALARLERAVGTILVARGVTGRGLAQLVEQAQNLGIPLEWLAAGVRPRVPS